MKTCWLIRWATNMVLDVVGLVAAHRISPSREPICSIANHRKRTEIPIVSRGERLPDFSLKYWDEVGTKFGDRGMKFDELGTKYNPEVIKYTSS